MKKNTMVVAAVLFSVLLLSPIALANVYVPPGPPASMDAWISPTLIVIDMQDAVPAPIGWLYSDGPMYDNVGQLEFAKIEKEFPYVLGKLEVEFSTKVVVFGWIPKLYVSPGEVPPPVEIVITWNGIPYLVTLTLPSTQVVGKDYPPTVYPDLNAIYEFAFPAKTAAHFEKALFNIWVGDIDDVRSKLSFALPDVDFPFGYFFWYIFHPNAGDWISLDCQPGKTKHPPTYDVTALFEYSTSQIWFNHVCFDVRFLEVHKTLKPNPLLTNAIFPGPYTIGETIEITNIGKVAATRLDIYQTYPSVIKDVTTRPKFETAWALLLDKDGKQKAYQQLTITAMPFILPAPFDTLLPLEKLIITMDIEVSVTLEFTGTVVFDLIVSANEIPKWKWPRSMDGLMIVGTNPIGSAAYLWEGFELISDGSPPYGWHFTTVPEWPVITPIVRMEPEQLPPKMKLDPVPVDLTGDGKIDAQDVALVRQAIVGLVPYDHRMDINVNGKIDTQDLAAYKLSAT